MIEQGFDTLYSQICAIMTLEGPHENLKTDLWTKCASNMNKLENIIVNPHEEKSAYEKLCVKMLNYTKNSNIFGEMLFVLIIFSVKAKL